MPTPRRCSGAEAAERYFFEPDYFRTVLGFDRSWLFLRAARSGATAAGAIVALSDGLLHYYLGGTAEAHLPRSPFKNVVEAMIDLADELGVPLNLGGGVKPGDGLEDFKRGFANARAAVQHARDRLRPRGVLDAQRRAARTRASSRCTAPAAGASPRAARAGRSRSGVAPAR